MGPEGYIAFLKNSYIVIFKISVVCMCVSILTDLASLLGPVCPAKKPGGLRFGLLENIGKL